MCTSWYPYVTVVENSIDITRDLVEKRVSVGLTGYSMITVGD